MTPPALSRRSLLAGGAVGLAAAAVPVRPAAAVTGSFSVATVNLLYSLDEATWLSELATVAGTGADLIGINEAYTHPAALAAWAKNNGYSLWQLPGDASDNALLARASSFQLDTTLSGGMAGTGKEKQQKPKPTFTSWAKYTHLATGLELYHVNIHLPPDIESRGRPANPKKDRRLKEAVRQLRKTRLKVSDLRAAGTAGPAEVIVTGDLNIDYRKDARVEDGRFPYRQWEYGTKGGDNSLVSCYSMHGLFPGTKGTHGKNRGRYIDYVYEYVPSPTVRRIAMQPYAILDLASSDHNAVVAPFTINTP